MASEKYTVALLVLAVAVGFASSGYVITTPRRWTSNANSQICVAISDGGKISKNDTLSYKLTEIRHKRVLTEETPLNLVAGQSDTCFDVPVPTPDDKVVTLQLKGTIESAIVEEEANLTFVSDPQSTFIQTDKYKYRPGQKVQFRILTINGPDLKVVKDNYEEVTLTTPSNTRIGQWKNVDNKAGLVHLEFDLYEEIEEGSYTIGTKLPNKNTAYKSFQVEDYVLPRYEVTIASPNVILGSDTEVTITVCAKYTFGEPVNGNATINVLSGSWRTYTNITQNKHISGCQDFIYNTTDLLFDQNNCHIRVNKLNVKVVVEEDGTGVQLRGENSFKINRKALQFKDKQIHFTQKQYMPQYVEIETSFQDNTPAKNEVMEVCTFYENEEICNNMTTSVGGVLSFVTPTEARSRISVRAVGYPRIERNWNDVMEESRFQRYSYDAKAYLDVSNNSITIYTTHEEQCKTGSPVNINLPLIYIVQGAPSANVHLQVISRGQVVKTESFLVTFTENQLPFDAGIQLLPLKPVPAGFVRGVYNVDLHLPPTVSPNVKILVWFALPDGSVVADNREVSISACLPHKVDFSFSQVKAEPGATTNLELSAAPDALCSVGVVDKSVELLSPRLPLKINEILEVSYNSRVGKWDNDQLNLKYCYRKFGVPGDNQTTGPAPVLDYSKLVTDSDVRFNRYSHVEAIHMFKDSGYFVMSNLLLEKHFCDDLITKDLKAQASKLAAAVPIPPGGSTKIANRISFSAGLGGGARPSPQAFHAEAHADVSGIENTAEVTTTVVERNYLPETWLWNLKTVPADGKLSEPVTLPHQITEWVGRAVCVHSTQGVGISEQTSITTFTNFFVDLTLPAAAKRGEILPIKVSVFNYLPEDLPVTLSVEPNSDFSFVDGETGSRQLCIQSRLKSVETFNVLLLKAGDINITVDASTAPSASGQCGSENTPQKSDRFVRSLPVDSEGYPREKTFTKYICSQDVANATGPIDTWIFESPAGIVEGSERAYITTTGDLMGPTVENLGNLVGLPSGCGEQNLINFAPNVYVLQYLDASGQTNKQLRERLLRYMIQGYHRQLIFQRREGGYSAFGNKDLSASVWLTAFVVKSLSQAKNFIDVDEKSLQKSVTYLRTHHRPDGCYESTGRVINKMLQGGIKGNSNPEALLTAYILAALLEEGTPLNKKTVTSSIACIKTDNSTHPYSLALKAYALVLAKDKTAKALLDKLLSVAVKEPSEIRWVLPDKTGKKTSLHVETAAYVLLALVKFDPALYATESRAIVRYLSSLRNGRGGFVSTQDTVVALQALAAFEKIQVREPLNMNVKVAASTYAGNFAINDDNKFLLQRLDVPDIAIPSTADVTISGTGCVLAQGVLVYNVLADSLSDAFALRMGTEPQPDCRTFHINPCTSYKLPDTSNMAIIEIQLISGYKPDIQSLQRLVGDGKGTIKRYEVTGKKIDIYLDEVVKQEVCAPFIVHREVDIGNAKEGSVSVYDYYQPEFITTQKYKLHQACTPTVPE